MKTTKQYNYSVPLPANIPPTVVLSVMQSCIPFMTTSKTIISFTEQAPDPSVAADDPFFGPWDDSFRCFQCQEVISLAPRLSKTIEYQVLFKPTPDGVRTRAAAAAGVTIRSDYSVRPRPGPTSPAGSDSTGSSVTVVGDEYELNEDMSIEANSLLMQFVTGKALDAHQHIVNAIIDQITKNYFGVPIAVPWENDGNGTWRRITNP
ncbi:hypothetical protein B0T10DRAFT_455408 [Thelonectria olida]|uniref:DUF7053 domain-containing protein n=1 Tax=Thelonectria olida TaxID=1576542 RepID=A0A9P9ATY4_9HYPO|nr:hypothetical protein B0T10DRAFT_455408 [Thelonectria olida]